MKTTYKAIFFDLDGTLLNVDMDAFIQDYFVILNRFAQEKGYDETFFKAVLAGTKAMTKPDGRFNDKRFWETFEQMTGVKRSVAEPLMLEFYEGPFNELGEGIVQNPAAAQTLQLLFDKGYTLYLTTMPLFPRIAVERRLVWAGCPVEVFSRITTYDNSTSTKPFTQYYQENLDHIGLSASEVLMVGNNTLEDLDCRKIGIDAYLVTDNLLNPNNFDVNTVEHGLLEDFLVVAKTMPSVGK